MSTSGMSPFSLLDDDLVGTGAVGEFDRTVLVLHRRLLQARVGRCTEGTLQAWLAIAAAEIFGPLRVATEVGLDAREFDEAPPEWREHLRNDPQLGHDTRRTRLHNAEDKLEIDHDLVILGAGATPAVSIVDGDITVVAELKATNSARLKPKMLRDDVRKVALTAAWRGARHPGRPAPLAAMIVVATSPGRWVADYPDLAQLSRWLGEHVPGGVRAYILMPDGVRAGWTPGDAPQVRAGFGKPSVGRR
jgi:hypothetical protein